MESGEEAPVVQPGVTPTTLDVEVIATQRGMLVHVIFHTIIGQFHVFWPPNEARFAAQMLEVAGARAASGIILPPGTTLPDQPDPSAS
jgi:hypothetical protein